MEKKIRKKYYSEEAVKKALQIDSFRNLSKEKVMEFTSIIPYMEKEVAMEVIKQFPVYVDFAKTVIEHYTQICETILATNKEEYEKASKQIEEKELTVKKLQQRLTELENKDNHIVRSRQDLEDEIRFLTDAKEQAEKEKHKLETNLEKIKQQQKDKERKNTSISDSELKRISSIAKTEQALNLLENNFDVLKNNKQTLQHDPDLKIRVELLKRRMDDLLVSINE